MGERGRHGTALGVVVESYDRPAFPVLPGARRQMSELCALLQEYGYAPRLLEDPGRDEVRDAVRSWSGRWREEGRHGPAVVLWSGHAELSHGALRLIARDTADIGDEEQTYSTELLASAALRCGADQILLVVDTCHSGAGVLPALRKALQTWAERTLPEGRSAWLGVVASCQPEERAHGRGVLLDTLTRVLREGPGGSAYRHEWSVRNRGVTGATVVEAALAQWPQDSQRPLFVSSGSARPIFRNPRWRREAGEDLVEHLVLAARGASGAEEGWFFTGRRRVLESIVSWMRAARPGLFQVTGSAGSGKSAVLGRIATLSDPRQRAATLAHGALGDLPDPGEGSVDAALHLRGLNAQQIATALADKLGLPAPRTPSALIKELEDPDAAGERPPLIVLDGLDEAAPEQSEAIVEQLLAPLSRVASVLLGSRDRPFRPHGAHRPTLDDALTRFVSTTELVGLDEEPDTAEDVAAYVGLRLRSEGVAEHRIRDVAPRLAERAVASAGGFLFARLVTTSLIRRWREHGEEAWHTALPASIAAAFEEDLDNGPPHPSLGTQRPAAARELLTALAWSADNGMPAGGVWEMAASACSHDGWTYQAADLDWVLTAYGQYIVEDTDGLQAVYRLYHRELMNHLRYASLRETDGGEAICRAMVARLRDGYERGVPKEQLPPYLFYALVSHALMAGDLGIALLREMVPLDEQTFLPALAVALNDHALIVTASDGPRAALAEAEEAVAIRRALMPAAPETHRLFFAGSLLQVAQCRSDTGDREGALSAAREAADAYRELVRASAADYLPGLAGSLHLLARCLRDAGDREGALAAAHEATEAYRKLSTTVGAAYLPNLADSLHILANRLAGAGEFAPALAAAREAVEVSRPFAEADPAVYLEGFAMFLNTFAISLARTGAYRAALRPAVAAVEAHRELAGTDRAATLPGLAVCLHNLSLCLSRAGEPEAALSAANEAAETARELAVADAVEHLPQYAVALGNLSDRAADCGRDEEALALAQRSTEICRELVGLSRETHLPALASALHHLSLRLTAVRQDAAARASSQEATDLYRVLEEESPGRYRHELATCCETLALRLAEHGETATGLPLAREAVDLRRALARSAPMPPRLSSLAGALESLAECEAACGSAAAAHDAATEALGFRRRLAEADPAAHVPALAGALWQHADQLARSADRRGALGPAREAVALLRPLCGPHSTAYRLSLANALSTLARAESMCDHAQEALAAAQEAVDTYRALGRDGSGTRRRSVAGSLLNLARCQARAKDPSAAAASAREAVEGFLELARISPGPHLDNVLTALAELTDYLSEIEQIAAVRPFYDTAVDVLSDHPAVVRRLRYERTMLLLYEDAVGAGTDELIRLLTEAPEVRDEVTFDARGSLRHPPDDDHDRVRAAWVDATGSAPPAWLALPSWAFSLVYDWLGCPDWTAARRFWEQHEERLATPEVTAALAEVAMVEWAEQDAGHLLRLVRGIPATGADAAFLPFVLSDRLGAWVLDEPRTEVHDAVLHLARHDGVDAAQRCLEGPPDLARRARQAGVALDAVTLRHCAVLERAFLGDHYTARVHLAVADILAGTAAPAAAMPSAPDEAVRDRAIEDLVEIMTRQPGHAAPLRGLLTSVLARDLDNDVRPLGP
ncbi:tetratricopeptide repeat protein [Streptomyces sp. NPDC058989]|uniref:tetratricopeptide repeat protein n=1 Tax=Streptomyces sp. NPDC058989 TaxID=3346686 RepID=UPI0036C70C8E